MSYGVLPKSYTWQCLMLLLSLQLLSIRSQEGRALIYFSCDNTRGNFTVNSTYEVNLKSFVSSLSSLPHKEDGFYNFAVGETDNEKVNSLMLCRGDIKPADCVGCIVRAGQEIREQCPDHKEATMWYDHCMLRYSNRTIFNTMETSPGFYLATDFDFPGEKDAWEKMLRSLLEGLMIRAAAGGPGKKFAVSKTSGPSLQTLYSLMQCTPDISERDCIDCLTWNIGRIPILCNTKMGCRQATVSCNLRYDTSRFYDVVAEEPIRALPPAHLPSPPSPFPPPPSSRERVSEGKTFVVDEVKGIIFIVLLVGGGIFFAITSCFIIFLIMRRRKKHNQDEEMTMENSLRREFSAVRLATNNFSAQNELGKGGFGKVYKGILNGQEVAVKRLSANANQGENEFRNEVLSLASISHCNLVRLVGFAIEKDERALIYEFLPNKSLDKCIFGNSLGWATRYRIIKGVAQGILYLHQDSSRKIIHRDLKPANVLLDKDMKPKIADFGLARLFDESHISKVTTEKIMGTRGYIAPEYQHHGTISFKIDVYSFGVLVLEILSGIRLWESKIETDEEDLKLIEYAKKMYIERKPLKLEDSKLEGHDKENMLICIGIGLRCVEQNPSDRPNMKKVCHMLEKTNFSHAPSPSPYRGAKAKRSRVHV